MRGFILLLVLCHVAPAVKHTMKYFITASSGVSNFPQFVAAAVVDGVLVGYCDSDKKIVEPKLDWVKTFLENNPEQVQWYKTQCLQHQPHRFKARLESLRRRFNQTGGVHVLQRMEGVEWDNETGEISGFNQYGYDGEDFISFDLKTQTWVAPKPQAVITKQSWDADKARNKYNEMFFNQILPGFLKKYLAYGRSSLMRTDLPSVSLLQKTPSSPISCHATGFYPDSAVMFGRKDGEELHEHVEYGEILPNHDGTFQMSVDLNVSSVRAEDWRRYDCVFQLSGGKDDIVTRLDKAVIRTNWEKPSDMSVPITAVVVVLALVLIAAAGLMIYKRKKAKCPPSSSDTSSELSKELNPKK